MKTHRELPVPRGQTDMFADSAIAGIAPLASGAPAGGRQPVPMKVASETVERNASIVPGGAVTNRALSRKRLPGGSRASQRAAKPVTAKTRHGLPKKSRTAKREATRAKQAKSRARKIENGLQRIEAWVPRAIKKACRILADREGASVDCVAARALVDVFGGAAASGARNVP